MFKLVLYNTLTTNDVPEALKYLSSKWDHFITNLRLVLLYFKLISFLHLSEKYGV